MNLIFYIDPNEEREDGLVPISMRFTVNFGADVLAWGVEEPTMGTEVALYSDEDRTRYRGMVDRVIDSETILVRVKWESAEEEPDWPEADERIHPMRPIEPIKAKFLEGDRGITVGGSH